MKAANTGIKQLNFINMPKYTYINICNTFFSIWEHIKSLPSHKIAGPMDMVLPRWTKSQEPCFQQCLNHRKFGFSFQGLILFKLSLGQGFPTFLLPCTPSAFQQI